jgi:hypothetical protein
VTCGSNDRITLNSNGTWFNNETPQTSGTWSTNGNTLVLASPGQQSESFTYTVNSNNTLTISGPSGASTVTLTLGRILG